MQVFLIRHAEAVDETVALRDPFRHLTPHGRQQARDLGDRLRWHDCGPSHVWSSPLVRAIQTAELALGRIDTDVSVDTAPELAPDGAARKVVANLKVLSDDAQIFLVGHEPLLSAIGSLLTNDQAFGVLAKAEAVRLDGARIRWRFAWNAVAPATRSV